MSTELAIAIGVTCLVAFPIGVLIGFFVGWLMFDPSNKIYIDIPH